MKVYLELDAALDTRLAVVSSLDQQAAVKLVTSDAYYQRLKDDFSDITGIPHETYKQVWESRTADILPRSIKTHIPILLNKLMHHLEYLEETTPYMPDVALEVNVWPYVDLTMPERDMLQLAFTAHSGINTIPQIVCFDPKELTPRRLRNEYSGLILYNLRDWLQHHLLEFPKCICPDVSVLAPALFYDRIVTVKDICSDPDLKEDVNIFQLTEIACAEFFQLNLLDPKYFSIWRDGV